MKTYIAFDLYEQNAQGGHQRTDVGGGLRKPVYLANEVDALLQKVRDARLTWAMVCNCECTGCDALDEAIRSLMVRESQ